jgi:hypothetical protein
MSTAKQNMVDYTNKGATTGHRSSIRGSDKSLMINMYAQSPIFTGDLTDDKITSNFQNDVLDAIINDGGHAFGLFDTSYVSEDTAVKPEGGSPDLAQVVIGGAGLPASPYVPNPTSPGEGSMNSMDQASAPEDYGTIPNGQFGSGAGHAESPKSTAEGIGRQTLGGLTLGQSITPAE